MIYRIVIGIWKGVDCDARSPQTALVQTQNPKLKTIFSMGNQSVLGIIAGNGVYPFLIARAARQSGVAAIHVAAFENETQPELADHADSIEWMRVGQLSRLMRFFEKTGVRRAIMAGQIAPKNLFDLRPDFRVLTILGSLKRRNAETLFGAVGDELAKIGVDLLPATTYLEESLANEGLIAGPKPRSVSSMISRSGLRSQRS
jgi:DUF1009 family protein